MKDDGDISPLEKNTLNNFMRGMRELLRGIPTRELVEDLKGREGVECKIARPYEDMEVSVKGPAIVLVVVD